MTGVQLLPVARAEADRAASRWSRAGTWILHRWPALALATLTLPVAAATLVAALSWIGRPFPGFFVMGNGLIPTVGNFDWTGLRAGVPFLDRVISIDGRPVKGNAAIYDHAATLPEGTSVRYEFTNATRSVEITVPTMTFTRRDFWLTVGIFGLCGVLASALGIGVGLAQPDTAAARAFLLQGTVTGLYALTGTALYHPQLWFLAPLYCVTQTLLPATFIHLVLVFPVARRLVVRRPLVVWIPYAIATALILWLLPAFVGSPPDPTPLYATFGFTAVGLVTWMAVPIYTYWENRTPRVRAQLNVVIPGLVLASAIALLANLDHTRSGGRFPLNLMAITVPLFYAAIAYAILRFDLFDVDALVKQAAVYGTLTVAATAAYGAMLGLASAVTPTLVAGDARVFNVAFLAIVAVLFEPARRGLQLVVDRTFFRGRLDYRETVREVSAALTTVLDLGEIVSRVGHTVLVGFQVESFSVLRWTEQGTERAQVTAAGTIHDNPGVLTSLRSRLTEAPTAAFVLAEAEETTDQGAAELQELGAELVVPLAVAGRLVGAFAVGPRRSGRPFTRSDLDLLGTLAAQSAVAIDNAQSFGALQELNAALEDRVRSRTAELEKSYHALEKTQAQLVQSEKMASLGVLVAGVAHEINNPVSFIVNNVPPLQDVLHELQDLAQRHPEVPMRDALDDATMAVRLMAEGAKRTAGIVNDLRTFSRMADAETGLVDLREGMAISERLLRPRWADRIQLHLDLDALPRIEGAAGPLNQVLMNLLSNACDAITGPGNIWITGRHEPPWVHIDIRDDGCGIDPDRLSRIFDPFFTTKPPGRGTGLGLAIAHGIVTSHGGRITVTSAPGAGTTMTVTLPIGAATPTASSGAAHA